MDKRARYAAQTSSLLLDIRQEWLDEEVSRPGRGGTLRSRRGVLSNRLPTEGAVWLPVRHVRVLIAVPDDEFVSLAKGIPLQGHEFLCPYEKLEQFNGQVTQQFLKRMAPSVHVFPTRRT